MFTGIVEELGVVKNIEKRSSLLRLGIAASFAADVKIGDSIAVNGVCLTVIELGGHGPHRVMFFDVMLETLKTTSLSKLKLNDKVNLEQALKANDRLGGHIVAGHIDTVGYIKRKEAAVFDIAIGEKFINNVVEKGSVAIDGISLTAAKLGKDFITVNIIPHTLKETTFGLKKQGDSVNIEFDVLGKYASQNVSNPSIPAKSKITEEFLREHGF